MKNIIMPCMSFKLLIRNYRQMLKKHFELLILKVLILDFRR